MRSKVLMRSLQTQHGQLFDKGNGLRMLCNNVNIDLKVTLSSLLSTEQPSQNDLLFHLDITIFLSMVEAVKGLYKGRHRANDTSGRKYSRLW